MRKITTPIDSGLMRFSITDIDGDEIGWFRLNPTDVRLVSRAEEISKFFEQHKTGAGLAETEDILEEKICDLLGYDARKDLFGILSATTVMPNGEMFLLTILNAIHDAIKPELEARGKKMQERMQQYTRDYETVQPT